ncbi:MAG: 3-oxoacyl-[acyl-carrier-protein] reductase [Negativicoccus succinicivorans]|uniref:3-oxoacyl-[acyl-carrier-protein] reductase n=1 Tax=Negativicoccus succinicivorans TaxID=620903 RepID=UPI002908AAF4|nr:3-oxoacyl-[acyl-carrier-protein] reductase [Negativicoccus succinicivorans]MDU5396366.1 3-oxoacyl-[acyl-carrier-protein] reductase [Negativicoccus succinicivorans]MDU5914520.1 3-oxoacyl-[acyl-carrier-protein] reductase [Negativicoccus succinicivorans]
MTTRTALVTGASRGIGRAVAVALAQAGYDVAINYSSNVSAAEEVAQTVKACGQKAILVQGDVSQKEEAERIVAETQKEFSHIDVLVNNAGITRDTLVRRMKEADWDAVLSTNLKGVFLMTQAVIGDMFKQRRGVIINMSSVVGVTGNIGQANYAAAKAGVIGLTKANAKEFAARGIRVNAIAPGFIHTDMTSGLPDKIKESLIKQIPLGAMGDPEDIAAAVRFLASDEAKYITGQVLQVNGGMAM